MNIIIYERTTGKIVRSTTCTEEAVERNYNAATQDYLEHDRVDDARCWVNGGEVQEFAPFAVSVWGTVISSIPEGTVLTSEGESHVITGGVAELEFDVPGTYSVLLSGFPHLDTTVEVTQP